VGVNWHVPGGRLHALGFGASLLGGCFGIEPGLGFGGPGLGAGLGDGLVSLGFGFLLGLLFGSLPLTDVVGAVCVGGSWVFDGLETRLHPRKCGSGGCWPSWSGLGWCCSACRDRHPRKWSREGC
jgi:hypothetical protein